MRMQSVAWVSVVMAVAGAAVAADKPVDELLLLGVRDQQGALSTWIGDGAGLKRVGSGLAVPRAEGWWRLDVVERKTKTITDRRVFAYPAANPAKPPALDPNECAGDDFEMNTGQQVLFVGSDWYSVQEENGGYCGGAHPFAGTDLRTCPIGSDKYQPIEAVLGPAAGNAFVRDAATAHGGEEKRTADCLGDPYPESWGMIRVQGKWIARGLVPYLAEACRGGFDFFTINFEVPDKLSGGAPLKKSWQDYAAQTPGLIDVAASRGGSLLLKVTKDGFELEHDGKSAARSATKGAAIVMVQWAQGKGAERWRKEVPALFSAR